MRAILAASCVVALALAASWPLRVACADYGLRQETLAGAEMALRLTSDQSTAHTRLALLVEGVDRERATKALERAAALNPFDTEAYIQLGLRREAEGDLKAAERNLREAATHDRQYLPRWTLVNYYFRRGDTENFWRWAKAAAEMVHDDGTALFRLCGAVEEDGRLIERIGIGRPEVQAHYVGYLLRAGRIDVLMPAVRMVLPEHRASDVPLLLNACDRLLDDARVSEALELWNGLAEAHLIPLDSLDPPHGRILTNDRFRSPTTSHGFDWRFENPEGITAAQQDAGGLRLSFSGRQPEHCDILWKLVPLPHGSEYELNVTYGESDIADRAGLTWRISDAANNSSPRLARIALSYHRVPGTTRTEGYVTLREVQLRPKVYGAGGRSP